MRPRRGGDHEARTGRLAACVKANGSTCRRGTRESARRHVTGTAGSTRTAGGGVMLRPRGAWRRNQRRSDRGVAETAFRRERRQASEAGTLTVPVVAVSTDRPVVFDLRRLLRDARPVRRPSPPAPAVSPRKGATCTRGAAVHRPNRRVRRSCAMRMPSGGNTRRWTPVQVAPRVDQRRCACAADVITSKSSLFIERRAIFAIAVILTCVRSRAVGYRLCKTNCLHCTVGGRQHRRSAQG